MHGVVGEGMEGSETVQSSVPDPPAHATRVVGDGGFRTHVVGLSARGACEGSKPVCSDSVSLAQFLFPRCRLASVLHADGHLMPGCASVVGRIIGP